MPPVASLGKSAGTARYAVLTKSLLEGITNGGYPVGSMLPTELELCEQFGVSRTTVREAIRRLRDMGLVSRKAGIGTHVRAQYSAPRYVHSIESISDIFRHSKATAKPVLLGHASTVAAKDEEELRDYVPAQHWVRFEFMRSLAGKDVPMVHVRAYMQPAYESIIKLIPTRRDPVYTLIQREHGDTVVEVLQEFKAALIPAQQARILKVKAGSAGLYVVRHYIGEADRLILLTLSMYPSDRFSYAMRLRYAQRSA